MDYKSLFLQAAHILRNNKLIWKLGLLAVLGGGTAQSISIMTVLLQVGISNSVPSHFEDIFISTDITPARLQVRQLDFLRLHIRNYFEPGYLSPELASRPTIVDVSTAITIIYTAIGLFIVFRIITWLIRLVAEAGIIRAVFNLEAKKTFDLETVKRTGRRVWWRFILLALLFELSRHASLMFNLSTSIYNGFGVDIFFPISVISNCVTLLLFPLTLFLLFVYPFAQREIVTYDLGVIGSLKHGWIIVKNNFSAIIILGIFFHLLGLISGFVSIVSYIIAFLFLIMSILNAENELGWGFVSFFALVFLFVYFINWLVDAFLVAYRSAVFTLAYTKFTEKIEGTL